MSMKETFFTLKRGSKEWSIQSHDTKCGDAVFYIDMCPCDDMDNYMPIGVMPNFVKEDTPQFDEVDAFSVVQVATEYGWAIVAKWGNNGSTRIYALRPEVIVESVAILNGACDSGDCSPAYGEYTVRYKPMRNAEDRQVFRGVMWSQIYR